MGEGGTAYPAPFVSVFYVPRLTGHAFPTQVSLASLGVTVTQLPICGGSWTVPVAPLSPGQATTDQSSKGD